MATLVEKQKEDSRMRFRWSKDEGGIRSWWRPFGYDNHLVITNDFYFGRKDPFSVELSFKDDPESTIGFHFCVPFLISWYFSVDALWGYKNWWKSLLRLPKEFSMRGGRRFGFGWLPSYGCVDGGSLRLMLGAYENETRHDDPKWLDNWWSPQRFFCGEAVHSERVIEQATFKKLIKGDSKYPDKEYVLKAVLSDNRWDWKRFKKPLVLTRCEVSCEEGIPHPGKGTTGYNCDEGRLYSSSTVENDAEKAIEKFVEQVYWYRKNYPL